MLAVACGVRLGEFCWSAGALELDCLRAKARLGRATAEAAVAVPPPRLIADVLLLASTLSDKVPSSE